MEKVNELTSIEEQNFDTEEADHSSENTDPLAEYLTDIVEGELWDIMANREYSLVEELIRAGIDPNVVDLRGIPLLVHAVQAKSIRMVEFLLIVGADPNEGSPLRLACKKGLLDVVYLLLERGVDLNGADSKERLPLQTAILNDQSVIAHLLISAGADPNAKSRGLTPLVAAIKQNNFPLVNFLLKKGAGVNFQTERNISPLFVAAFEGCEVILTRLLEEEDIDVDPLTEEGITPLMVAAMEGHQKIVDLLLKAGAGVGRLDLEGRTVLDYAKLSCNKKMIKTIRDAIRIKAIEEGLAMPHESLFGLVFEDLLCSHHAKKNGKERRSSSSAPSSPMEKNARASQKTRDARTSP